MSLAIVFTRSTIGIDAKSVVVEVHLSQGLPAFTIVGLPEASVRESKDRVRSAILNSQFEFPSRRITVNLAPANLPKSGSGFDLPIALGILAASEQISKEKLSNYEFLGELALTGDIREVHAIIPVILASARDEKNLIIPRENSPEARLILDKNIYTASHFKEVVAHLQGIKNLPTLPTTTSPQTSSQTTLDFSDIAGQEHAKKAMIIAGSGGHSILLHGTPGSGKTMLATRFHTLLPALTQQEALEVAAIYSISGRPQNENTFYHPPLRMPHHTASHLALVGGGNPPKPGEISLAHHGVLFLDELPEFSRKVLETLREPLESGNVTISRAAIALEFPARFQLIAAMNPCPCGHFGNPKAVCICSPERIQRYLAKLSAPLLDRIDLLISIAPVSEEELLEKKPKKEPLSPILRETITKVRERQYKRQGKLNAYLDVSECESVSAFNEDTRNFIKKAMRTLNLSARATLRLMKVARTIADYNEEEAVSTTAITQALSYKQTLPQPR